MPPETVQRILIDWETGILNAVRPVLARHGIPPDDDTVLETYAVCEAAAEAGTYRSYREVLTISLREMVSALGDTLAESDAFVLADSVGDWPAFPDTVESLRRLGQRYRLAILSNIDDEMFAQTAERHLGGSEQFAAVVTAEQVRGYKPGHAHFLTGLERLGLARENVLHVAQSLYHDIVPARELGIPHVWINRRAGRNGSGATAPAPIRPDREAPDLATLTALLAPPQ
jgi:2-haloacid dehalogenase